MSDGFCSFAAMLTRPAAVVQTTSAPPPPRPDPIPQTDPHVAAVLAGFATEIVRLRARAVELVERDAEALVTDIARHVLARELAAAPPDLPALVAAAAREWTGMRPVRFRVAAVDAERVSALGDVEIDPSFVPGDLQIELADGVVDLRLGMRLAAVLEEHRVAL